jgi:transcriptional regulator GlxA family with amidase domain
MPRVVAILVFPEVEILDFAGPFEVFGAADETSGGGLFRIVTVAESPGPVTARHGLRVMPDHSLADCPAADIVVLPGGFGTRRLENDSPVHVWLRHRAAAGALIMSVCTGSIVLARAGLLDGLRATTHHSAFDRLRAAGPKVIVEEGARFTDNGTILTAAGISAGIDCALHVVGRLIGPDVATATARYLEHTPAGATARSRDSRE